MIWTIPQFAAMGACVAIYVSKRDHWFAAVLEHVGAPPGEVPCAVWERIALAGAELHNSSERESVFGPPSLCSRR